MQAKAYYTVIASQGGFIVKFAEPPSYEVQEFQGTFRSADEAKGEFKKFERFQLHAFLDKTRFERRIRHCLTDLARLKSWNTGGSHE